MGSLASLAELEVDADGQTLYVSQADVQDCFWQCRIPHDLARWFCMDVVSGALLKKLGVFEVEGQVVNDSDNIYPMIHCLPMGFSWAMWFVQQVSESHTKVVIPESPLVRDGRPAPDIRGGESAASA